MAKIFRFVITGETDRGGTNDLAGSTSMNMVSKTLGEATAKFNELEDAAKLEFDLYDRRTFIQLFAVALDKDEGGDEENIEEKACDDVSSSNSNIQLIDEWDTDELADTNT